MCIFVRNLEIINVHMELSSDTNIRFFSLYSFSLVPVFEWPLHQDNWFYIRFIFKKFNYKSTLTRLK